MIPSLIRIGDVLISSEIVTEYFACDYQKCKGCCCIIGDSGAPLKEEECELLERNYKSFSPLMTDVGRSVVARTGFFDVDIEGDLVTPLTGPARECVYAIFDDDENCFCSVERAYISGKGRFRKPISCWLYPIRESRLSNGLTALNLHRWNLCSDAFIKGEKEKVRVYQFVREPLIERFGEEFYDMLCAAAEKILL